MPKYDAFGREIGEDSLAGIRGDTPAPAAAQPVAEPDITGRDLLSGDPLVQAAPEQAAPAQPRISTAFPEHRGMPSAPRRTGAAGIVRTIVAVVVLSVVATVGFGIYAVVDSVQDSVDVVDDVFDATTVPGIPREAEEALEDATKAAPAEPSTPAAEPKGLQRGSMLTRAELSRALGLLRPYGRLRLLRVAPERVDAQLVSSSGKLRLVQVRPGGAGQVISTSDTAGGGPALVSLGSVNAAAPFRLTRSAAGRLRRPSTQVDYAVLLNFAGTPQWSVFFKGGKAFAGDARGRVIRQIQ